MSQKHTYPSAGKPARTDRDKDTRPLVVARQLLGHEAVQERRADHEADEVARALDGDGGQRDQHRVDGAVPTGPRRGGYEIRAEGGGEEERVGWEDPDGGLPVVRGVSDCSTGGEKGVPRGPERSGSFGVPSCERGMPWFMFSPGFITGRDGERGAY